MTFGDQGDLRYGYIKVKKFKINKFTVRGGFFTFWAILAHSVPLQKEFDPIVCDAARQLW